MNIAIIGNGIAGVTVANKIREIDKKAQITIISAESEYFYSRPALMYIYMRSMKFEDTMPYEKKHWKKKKINLIQDWVTSVDYDSKILKLKEGNDVSYDKLVFAVGSKPNRLGWPGQDLPGVTGLTNLQELENIEERTKNLGPDSNVVIVGGGLIGIEAAEMMHSRKIPATFLVREPSYWSTVLRKEEGDIVKEEITDHGGVDLRLSTELKQINAGPDGSVGSVETNHGETIQANLVILAAGVSPNVDFLRNTKLNIGRGIQVNRKLETNIPDVYACGDCAEIKPDSEAGRPTIEALWYTGKMQGEILVENIFEANKEYHRGTWYNSAMFYTVVYHTFGLVGHNIPGEKELFFRIPGQKKSIRITYLDDKVIGFNFLGLKYRDNVCRKWLDEERSLDYVVKNLHEANFDGEFYEKYESLLREQYKAGRLVGK